MLDRLRNAEGGQRVAALRRTPGGSRALAGIRPRSRPFSRPAMQASRSSSSAARWPGRTERRSSATPAASSSSTCGASASWSSAYSGRSACQRLRSPTSGGAREGARRRPASAASRVRRRTRRAPARGRAHALEDGEQPGLEARAAAAFALNQRSPSAVGTRRTVDHQRTCGCSISPVGSSRARPGARGSRRSPPTSQPAAPRGASGRWGRSGPEPTRRRHTPGALATQTRTGSPLRWPSMAKTSATPWGAATVVDELSRPAAGGGEAVRVGGPASRSRWASGSCASPTPPRVGAARAGDAAGARPGAAASRAGQASGACGGARTGGGA